MYCTYRWHSTCVTNRGSRVRAGALLHTHQVSTDILQYFFIFRIGLLHDQIKSKIMEDHRTGNLSVTDFFIIFPHSCSFCCLSSLHSIGAEMLSDDSKYTAIPAWTETTRDFMKFNKRKGDLPMQQEGDTMDIRGAISLYSDRLWSSPARILSNPLHPHPHLHYNYLLFPGMMHRDGSVFSTVTMEDIKNSDAMYRALGTYVHHRL